MSIARVLIIAGSDSGGGAGIQADIKTVTMLGGHALTAITALTAQSTVGVSGVMPVPAEFVLQQIDAVVDDIGVDSVKVGMIGSPQTAEALAERLGRMGDVPIVFDPVMVASSGSTLADEATVRAFGKLMDVATIVTPNLPELAELSWGDDPVQAALKLVSDHRCAVMIKGGHDQGEAVVDALIEEDNMTSWQGSRLNTNHTHGTGCTLSTAIAVYLAQGASLPVAVDRARLFVRLALREAPGLGKGHGPMGHADVRLDAGAKPRLNHIMLPCRAYEPSLDFYRALGLRLIVDSPPDYARFEAPGGVTVSLQANDVAAEGVTLYLECDDLDEEVQRLSQLGIAFDQGPTSQPWLWREAKLRDPSGNMVCLYHAGEARRYPPWRVRSA